MIVMPDRKDGSEFSFKPLPPYKSSYEILQNVLPALRPGEKISAIEACEKYMKVNANGRWVNFDRDVTPYTTEPINMIPSRRYREIIFAGPARAGKTVILMCGACHSVMCDPGTVHLYHITERTARTWVEEEFQPMIENSPWVSDRLGKGVSDNNIFSKNFIGGTKFTVGPPVIGDLSARTIKLPMVTDIDRMPLTINNEGSVFSLASKRAETLRSRGMALGESSPGHPLTDPDWSPSAPHEAPPCDGILELYNGGTRARWYWDCPDCGDAFEPHFDKLVYDKSLSPTNAGKSAKMACPHCGVLIDHKQKNQLNRKGYWLHETDDGGLATLESGLVSENDRLSYWLNGAAATFSTWARIVAKYETAYRSYENGDDEEPLKVTTNVDQGMPYMPRAIKSQGNLTVDFLKGKQRKISNKHAPHWTRFIIVSFDVQKSKFVGQAVAYGPDMERMIIDRFDLYKPPKTAPRHKERSLAPESYIEDWDVLLPILTRKYCVEGKDYALTPMAIGCDFHGMPGVSDNAEVFWNKRKSAGEGDRWYMIRGHGGFKVQDLVWYKTPERANKGKKARKIKLLNIATDKMKDALNASLLRTDDGPNAMHIGSCMIDEHLKELTSESRDKNGWVPRKNMPRNEAIDLCVYCDGIAYYKGAKRINYSKPPRWALASIDNDFAVRIDGQTPIKKKKAKIPKKLF